MTNKSIISVLLLFDYYKTELKRNEVRVLGRDIRIPEGKQLQCPFESMICLSKHLQHQMFIYIFIEPQSNH